jgi:hypothetical protein
MESLPEQTAQTTAAIRKALDQQVKEIEQIAPVLTRAATQAVAQAAPMPTPTPMPSPAAPMPPIQGGGDLFRRGGGSGGLDLPPVGRPGGFPPHEEARPAQYDLPPMPKFDARGRQLGAETDQGAGNLAQHLSGGSYAPQGTGRGYGEAPDQGYAGGPNFGTRGVQQASSPLGAGNQLRLDELARAIDQRTAADVWYRFRSGDRGALGRHIYSLDGQNTFDEVARRYDRDADFRMTVDRYIADFERLLGEAEASDPEGRMLQNYLVSETGRVYLLLAHASGRLR